MDKSWPSNNTIKLQEKSDEITYTIFGRILAVVNRGRFPSHSNIFGTANSSNVLRLSKAPARFKDASLVSFLDLEVAGILVKIPIPTLKGTYPRYSKSPSMKRFPS